MFKSFSVIKTKLESRAVFFMNSKILFSGVLYRKGVNWQDIAVINNGIAAMCEAFNFVFVDSNSWIGFDGFAGDGLHLNRKGTDRLGALFSRIVSKEKNNFRISQKN